MAMGEPGQAGRRHHTRLDQHLATPGPDWWGDSEILDDGGSEPFRFLVPYNGSAVSRQALHVAAGLGNSRSAIAWILYVRPWDVARTGVRICLETSEEARRCAYTAVAELRRRGVPASGVIRDARRERVGQVIAAEAERLDVGCIVLGTHAHGAWLSALLGSVSRKVARRATRPVILVRAPHDRQHPGWLGGFGGSPVEPA
jgi:nucleotide-binding universal stress UspA family protein